jgi:hypothetical protein
MGDSAETAKIDAEDVCGLGFVGWLFLSSQPRRRPTCSGDGIRKAGSAEAVVIKSGAPRIPGSQINRSEDLIHHGSRVFSPIFFCLQ